MDGHRARALLGLVGDTDSRQLRRAFRRAVLRTHPDRGGNARDFAEVVAAFESLAVLARPNPWHTALARTKTSSTWELTDIPAVAVRRRAPSFARELAAAMARFAAEPAPAPE